MKTSIVVQNSERNIYQRPTSINQWTSIKYEAITPRVYKCRQCEFSTSDNTELKYHFLTHKRNVTIYKCEFCTFVTRHANVRDAHKITHMREDEVIWFDCKTCTFRTKFKGNLAKHELSHQKSNEEKR